MDSRSTGFRIILALTSLPQDFNLNNASLKVTLCNTTKIVPASNKDATPIDFAGVTAGSKIEFGLEDGDGFLFGYSELKIPAIAFEKNETEVNEQLRFYLINKDKDSLVVGIYAIFLNKGLFKERARERTSVKTTGATLTKSNSGDKPNSRSPTGSPGRRSNSKGNINEKTNDKNFQAYLNRLVDSHSTQLKTLIDEHNSVNEYIHINKVHNNLPPNFAHDNLETYSPTKLRSSTKLYAESFEADSAALSTSQYKVARFGGDETRDVTPLLEKEKRAFASPDGAYQDEEVSARDQVRREAPSPIRNNRDAPSPIRNRDAPSPVRKNRDAPSPLRRRDTASPSRVNRESASPARLSRLDSKFSDAAFSTPTRRRPTAVDVSGILPREVPDVTYYEAQMTSLNNVIVNQNARIADSDIYVKENQILGAAIEKSEQARKDLQQSVLETTNELKQENRSLERQITNIVGEKEELLQKISQLQNSVHQLTGVLSVTKANLQEAKDINAENELKLTEMSDLKQQFSKLQDTVIETENQKKKDQISYKAALQRFEESVKDAKKTIDNLNQEKRKLIVDVHQLQQELGLEKAAHEATQNELMLTQKKLENAENYREVVIGLETQRDQLTQQLADSRASHARTQHLLQESVETLAHRQKEFEVNEVNFSKETNILAEKLSISETKNDHLSKDLNEQRVKVSELHSTVTQLEQIVCVKEDVEKQLQTTEKHLCEANDDKQAIRKQLEAVCINQDQTNAKLLETEKAGNQLRQVVEEQDQEIEQLTAENIALRENLEVYIPAKGDVIDNAVADYVNSGGSVSKLKLLLIRESEGVYQFGSKKVYIKVEGGKVLIRVGGGFLTIEEFVDQYGPLEIEKFVRTDPLKKLTRNIAVNKALIGKCVNQMERPKNQAYEYKDSSNIRVMNSSPSVQRLNSKGDY